MQIKLRNWIIKILKDGKQDYEEFLLNGESEKIYRVLKNCYLNSEKEIEGIIGIMVDISKQKTNTLRLKHYIDNPLTLISNSIESISKNKKVDYNINRIKKNVNKLKKILRSADEIERLVKQHKFNPKKADIRKFCENIIKKNKTKTIDLLSVEKEILFDSYLLDNIIDNLILNSIKYTSDENYEIKLNISFNNNNTIIKISDNGVGIHENEKEKIWSLGYRAMNVKNSHQGSGTGLAYVKACIDLHNADIKVKSEVNNGTIFKITLFNTY
jgi:signal transduction histidine kinase